MITLEMQRKIAKRQFDTPASRHGPRPVLSAQDREEVRQMIASGATYEHVAERYGVTVGFLRNKFQRKTRAK